MTVEQLWRWLKKKFFSAPKPTGLHCGRCGEPLVSRSVCRECGASEDSGWGADYVGEETEDDFDYDDYIQREFGLDHKGKSSMKATWILILFIVLIGGMLLMQLGTVRY